MDTIRAVLDVGLESRACGDAESSLVRLVSEGDTITGTFVYNASNEMSRVRCGNTINVSVIELGMLSNNRVGSRKNIPPVFCTSF